MNPYFFDGYVAESDANYGLYDPIHNRFVMVSGQLEILRRCVVLLSSKAHLYIVPVTQAANYSPTLLDNHCCQNWGLAHIAGSDLLTEVETAQQLIIDPVPELIENPEPVSDLEKQLRLLAFLAHHAAQTFCNTANWLYRDYYDFVAWPQALQLSKTKEREIYRVIYLAQDYATAVSQVKDLGL